MKVGDLVIRKIPERGHDDGRRAPALRQRRELGHGLVLTRQMYGTPTHPCITVYYPMTGGIHDIAESLMEVINESR